MFKKTITFKDFNGDVQTKDFYFHISKSELLEMASDGDDMMKRLQRMISANDGKSILKEFRDLINLATGIRSEDGTRFIKTEEAKSVLMDSPAFDELLMELATDANAASNFVANLLPENMQQEMVAKMKGWAKKEAADDPVAEKPDTRPAWEKEDRHPTRFELMNASNEEIEKIRSMSKDDMLLYLMNRD